MWKVSVALWRMAPARFSLRITAEKGSMTQAFVSRAKSAKSRASDMPRILRVTRGESGDEADQARREASSKAGAREIASRIRRKAVSHAGLRKSIRVLKGSTEPVAV